MLGRRLFGYWSLMSILVLLNTIANAFPPAPSITYFGTARDSFGNAIDSSAKAFVVIKEGATVVAEAPIDERLRPGENFRVQIPVDLDGVDPYSPSALTSGDFVTISVRLPSGLLPVAGLSVGAIEVSEPSDRVRIDFFLGVDADGDGLPDDWELSQLEFAGIFPPDSQYSLDSLDAAGDFDKDGLTNLEEYIAGTFALLQSDAFSLRFVSQGITVDSLQTSFVFGKFYRLEASVDLAKWRPVRIRKQGASGDGALELKSTQDGLVNLEAIRSDLFSSEQKVFYRMIVR